MGINGWSSPSGFTIVSSTESFTCPGGAQTLSGGYTTEACSVKLASSHATFNITVNCNNAGSNGFAFVMIAEEVAGLGTFDSGSASAVSGSSSMTTTTANPNEYLWSFCADFSFGLAPGSGFSQNTESDNQIAGGRNSRGLTQYQITTSSGNYTTGCTSSGGTLTVQQIVALAFQQSSPPNVPAVVILQACQMNTSSGGASGGGGCRLSNVQAGNKIIVMQVTSGVLASATYSSIATETLTYVTGTWNTVVYGGVTYSAIIAYVDVASPHSTFDTDTSYVSCPGCTALGYLAMEVKGLKTAADTGSAAFCSAITCNYTTAINNEFTVMIAANTLPNTCCPTPPTPNQMTPGNGFSPWIFAYGSSNTNDGQYLGATKTTVSSGSNTGSYSQSGSTSPVMSLLSFGIPSGSRVKSKIL
jgi:hypothetical protein